MRVAPVLHTRKFDASALNRNRNLAEVLADLIFSQGIKNEKKKERLFHQNGKISTAELQSQHIKVKLAESYNQAFLHAMTNLLCLAFVPVMNNHSILCTLLKNVEEKLKSNSAPPKFWNTVRRKNKTHHIQCRFFRNVVTCKAF